MEPVTSPDGKKGFYDESTGFIPIESMEQVTSPEGVKGYYHEEKGFIPEPSANAPNAGLGIPNIHISPSEQTLTPSEMQDKVSQYGWETLKNIPGSMINVIHGAVNPIIHPVDTAKGVWNLIMGDEQTWGTLGKHLEDRYGGLYNLQKTIHDDPMGFLTDVSVLLGGTGGALKLAGKAGTLNKLTKAGEAVSAVSAATDPFKGLAKIWDTGAKGVGNAAAGFFGAETGTGSAPIKNVFQGKGLEGLRGRVDPEMVLQTGIDALHDLKTERGTNYAQQLDEISRTRGGLSVDPTPIYQGVEGIVKNAGGTISVDAKTGELVVDGIKKSIEYNNPGFKQLLEDVLNHKDWSILGADELKKVVDSFYSPNKYVGNVTSTLKSVIKREISKQVPEYTTMLKDYEVTSRDLEEIQKVLSLGNNASKDTALRKLNTIFRDVNEYRARVLNKFDDLSGGKLAEDLSGVVLNPALPRGQLTRSLHLGFGGAAGVGAGFLFHNPLVGLGVMATSMAVSSPRLVGETARKLGQVSRGIEGVTDLLPSPKYLYEINKGVNQ